MEFTEKNPKYFYELSEFQELKILEDSYKTILDELIFLRKNSKNGYWHQSFPHYLKPESKNTWQTFTFQFFNIKHPINTKLCPKTSTLLSKIPGLITAEFSYLPPHTYIAPHKGFTRMVLRAHLGLRIPDDCGIKVSNETKTWQEGKLLIFDDSFEHEAWNNSDEDRFILMLDIANPLWRYTAQEISRYKIENMEDESMLNMFSKEQWMEFYNLGEFTAWAKK